MQPGEEVYAAIVAKFGPGVVKADAAGTEELDRAALARIAFGVSGIAGRIEELNAIVHPAVIAAQGDWMRSVFLRNAKAVAVVESALIFEVERDARLRGESEGVLAYWRRRFDRVILVTAPDEVKLARYVARVSPSGWDEKVASDARSRLSKQLSDAVKVSRADFVLENNGDLAGLREQVDAVWKQLVELGNNSAASELIQ
jgi:dephospho-CoA kinase